jgi:hypothetical protein
MPDTHDTSPQISTGHRFSDDIRQLAYEIWLWEAGRNATRTQHLLAQECRAANEEQIDNNTGEITLVDDESLPIPTIRQVQRWVKDHDWEGRADDDVARVAPRLYKRSNARLFTTLPLAQEWDFAFLSDMCMRPNLNAGMAAVCEKLSARLQTLGGVGTAAGLMPVAMPSAPPQAIAEGATPQEMARMQRERLRELRGGS